MTTYYREVTGGNLTIKKKKVLLPRTDNFITLFMSCQNISYFASQDCRQPQIKEDCPSGLTIVFPGKNDEHSKAEDSGNYISVSHSPETCNLFLSFASFFFYFSSQACGTFEPEHKERNTNTGLTKCVEMYITQYWYISYTVGIHVFTPHHQLQQG